MFASCLPKTISNLRTVISMALVCSLLSPLSIFAQVYPSKPIRIVAPYPPGASTDAAARLIAQKMADSMGQPVVVENRGGASGTIGSDFVAKAAPDGYTLVLGTAATHATNFYLAKNFPYDPSRDFTPICAAVRNVIVLVVNPSLPVNSVREMLDYARNHPGKLAYGTSGSGSAHHLAGELLRQLTGVELVHVPYKGGGPAVTDLLGGQIPMAFASVVSIVPHVRTGKLRILATTGATVHRGLPGVPPLGETVPGFEMTSWLGILGPAGIPRPIVTKLNEEIVRALHAPDVVAKLEAQGIELIASTPEQFSALILRDMEKNGKLIRAAGIQPE